MNEWVDLNTVYAIGHTYSLHTYIHTSICTYIPYIRTYIYTHNIHKYTYTYVHTWFDVCSIVIAKHSRLMNEMMKLKWGIDVLLVMVSDIKIIHTYIHIYRVKKFVNFCCWKIYVCEDVIVHTYVHTY